MQIPMGVLVANQGFYKPEDFKKLGNGDSFSARKVAEAIGLFPTLVIIASMEHDSNIPHAFKNMFSDLFIEYFVKFRDGDRFWATTQLRPKIMECADISDVMEVVRKESGSKLNVDRGEGFPEAFFELYSGMISERLPWWRRWSVRKADKTMEKVFIRHFD